MKKIITSALVLLAVSSCVLATSSPAMAQYRDRDPRWERRGPPPPPPRHYRRNNTGAVIAGGLAAGVVGGLIGGAIAADNGPRYYVQPAPPPPRCWYEDRRVPNAYNGGSHRETIRVCR